MATEALVFTPFLLYINIARIPIPDRNIDATIITAFTSSPLDITERQGGWYGY